MLGGVGSTPESRQDSWKAQLHQALLLAPLGSPMLWVWVLSSGFQMHPSGAATTQVPLPDHLVILGPSLSTTAMPLPGRTCLPHRHPAGRRAVTSDSPPPSGLGPALQRFLKYSAGPACCHPNPGPGAAPRPCPSILVGLGDYSCPCSLPSPYARGPTLSPEPPCAGPWLCQAPFFWPLLGL